MYSIYMQSMLSLEWNNLNSLSHNLNKFRRGPLGVVALDLFQTRRFVNVFAGTFPSLSLCKMEAGP